MGYIKQSGLAADVPSNVPLIGINNFAGTTTVSSSTAAAGFPISNVVNPATHLKWKGNSSSGDEYVTVVFGGAGISAQPNANINGKAKIKGMIFLIRLESL